MTAAGEREDYVSRVSEEAMTQEESRPAEQCRVCEGSGRLVRTLERGEVSSDCGNCGGTGVLPARPAVEEGPRDHDREVIVLNGSFAVAIDYQRRVVALDGVSGGSASEPPWRALDLTHGTYGDFHRLLPAAECAFGCGEHVDESPAARPLVQEDDQAPCAGCSHAHHVGRCPYFGCICTDWPPLSVPADDPRDEDDDVREARQFLVDMFHGDDWYSDPRYGIETAIDAFQAAIERRRGVPS